MRLVTADQLERERAVERRVVGAIDGRPPARAQEAQVPVASERGARLQRPLARDSGREAGGLVGGLGLEGTVISIDGNRAEIDVRGKRIQARVKELRVIGPPSASAGQARVRVSVDLKPREGMLSELNVIGMTVDQAVDRVSRFLDDTLVTDLHEVRIVHGHGTGQLRKGLHAFLKTHPQVTKYYAAPENQGGGGATIVELKE